MHDILHFTDTHQIFHTTVLDLTKAFDQVPHSFLMKKFSEITHLDEYILHWMKNFLTNRTRRVGLQDHTSDPLPVTSGVPQELVLLLIFINELPACLDCSCALFAEDTLVYQER